jgi:hypothetical protein
MQMTDQRSGRVGDERAAEGGEEARPTDTDPTAESPWSGECGPDCGCLESWIPMTAAMCGDGSVISSCCAAPAETGSPTDEGATDRRSRVDDRLDTARLILDRRYASGDVTRDDYRAMLVDLESRSVAE